MARMDDNEYRRLKAFLAWFGEHMLKPGLPDDARPLARLEAIEKTSRARAEQGLRMAVNDIVEMTSAWPPAKVRAADAALRAAGLVSLTELRATASKKFAALLRRGCIRGEVEYHLAKGVLDGAVDALSAEYAAQLSEMIAAFEAQAIKE